MILSKAKCNEIMERKRITAEDISKLTGILPESVKWILDGRPVTTEAAECTAEALGVNLKEISGIESGAYRENVIEFLRDQEQATCTFTQGRYIGRIRRLAEQKPGECKILAENADGSVVAKVPVSWVKISPPREMSDEQRERLAEHLRNLHSSQDESD